MHLPEDARCQVQQIFYLYVIVCLFKVIERSIMDIDYNNEIFENVSSGSPVLLGHVFYKIKNKFGTLRSIREWINASNSKCNYKPIAFIQMKRMHDLYKKRNNICVSIDYTKPVSSIRATTCETEAASTSSSINPCKNKGKEKCQKIEESDFYKRKYQIELYKKKQALKENKLLKQINKDLVNKLKEAEKKNSDLLKEKEKNNKIYEPRKISYSLLLSGCTMGRVPHTIDNLTIALNYQNENLSNTSIRRLGWELGYFADFVTCHAVLQVETVTLVFDATTQGGIHVNCVILSTTCKSYLVSLEHLAGGTAPDYKNHICNSLRHLAEIYSQVSDQNADDCYKCVVGKIKSTLTDRAPVNHATIILLEEEWGKNLIELNCNLHPLEAASRTAKKILSITETPEEKEIYPGSECLAWKIMLGLNTLRFSPQKGDIMDFDNFWKQKDIKRNDIPRLRGNRLNIIFHLGGIYHTHFQDIKDFLKKFKKPNEVQRNLQKGFSTSSATVQFQVLGAIGKLLTGPWMHTFYTKEISEHNAHRSMTIVKDVLNNIRLCIQEPRQIFRYKNDFFGNPLDFNDKITKSVLMAPGDATEDFINKFQSCLEKIETSIKNQYEKSFRTVAGNLNEAMSSAREHTMFAESIIGEFSNYKKLAPNARVVTISNLIKSKRNEVAKFINDADKEHLFRRILDLAVTHGRINYSQSIELQKTTSTEIIARSAKRKSTSEKQNRKWLDKKIRNLPNYSTETLSDALPDISSDQLISVQRILWGTPESRSIEHHWEIAGMVEVFYGEIRCVVNDIDYAIFYYKPNNYDVGDEERISLVALAVDFLCDDMYFRR